MRLFILLALAAAIIALVVLATSTQFLGAGGLFWFALSWALYLVDLLAGGFMVAVPQARPPR